MSENSFFVRSGKTLINAVLSGIFIGIAGTVCLACRSFTLGAFLFSFGLLMILCNGFKLFTGAVGYLAVQNKASFLPYLWTLLVIWLGNLAGCFLVGSAIRMTRSATALGIVNKAAAMCEVKGADTPSSLLILAFFCGILMYLAVDTFKRQEVAPVIRLITVILCVSVFILSGFEHCIANMYYFSVAGAWNTKMFLLLLLMTLGNSLGGMFLPAADKFRN